MNPISIDTQKYIYIERGRIKKKDTRWWLFCVRVCGPCAFIFFSFIAERREIGFEKTSRSPRGLWTYIYIYIFTVLHYRWMPLRVLRHPTANAPDNHFDGFASPTLSFLSVFKINIIYMLQYAVCGVLVLFPPFFFALFLRCARPDRLPGWWNDIIVCADFLYSELQTFFHLSFFLPFAGVENKTTFGNFVL